MPIILNKKTISNIKLGLIDGNSQQITDAYINIMENGQLVEKKLWSWWEPKDGIPYTGSDFTYLYKKTNNDSAFTPFSDNVWNGILSTTTDYVTYSKAFETHYTIVKINEDKAKRIKPTFITYTPRKDSNGHYPTEIQGLWASAVDREHHKTENPGLDGWTPIPLNVTFSMDDLGLSEYRYLYIIMHVQNGSYAKNPRTPSLCVTKYLEREE